MSPHFDRQQSLIVKTVFPIRAPWFDLAICFVSGRAGEYPGDFTISLTSDPNPSLDSNWRLVNPKGALLNDSVTGITKEGHLKPYWPHAMIGDAIFSLRIPGQGYSLTGVRIDVFPFTTTRRPGWNMGLSESRDFCLTEIRIVPSKFETTNLALWRPAKASHPLWGEMEAKVLTDGFPGSFTHPAKPGQGRDFHFDIDLEGIYAIDHIVLRSRADGQAMDRMTRILLQLYEKDPDSGAAPVWEAMDRADGSFPNPGVADILVPSDGSGNCRGRYLRLSSDNPVDLSPQIAEVEVYGELVPALKTVVADGRTLSLNRPLEIPAGTRRLTANLEIPIAGTLEVPEFRWRLKGFHDDWQTSRNTLVEVDHPPPGTYQLEAQVRHTDGELNTAILNVPVVVEEHFWRTPAFFGSAAGSGVLLSLLVAGGIFRQREARRKIEEQRKTALAEERSRIARDMHDDVGARLARLAIMQELLTHHDSLSSEVKGRMTSISRDARLAIEALNHIVWATNPANDSLRGVRDYLTHLVAGYLAPLDIKCRIDVQQNLPAVEVRAKARHHLLSAVAEALQNVAKHSSATTVIFVMRYDAPILTVRIEDNGRGLDAGAMGPGQDGLTNMRSRLEAVGGVCSISSTAEGTAVEFKLSLDNS